MHLRDVLGGRARKRPKSDACIDRRLWRRRAPEQTPNSCSRGSGLRIIAQVLDKRTTIIAHRQLELSAEIGLASFLVCACTGNCRKPLGQRRRQNHDLPFQSALAKRGSALERPLPYELWRHTRGAVIIGSNGDASLSGHNLIEVFAGMIGKAGYLPLFWLRAKVRKATKPVRNSEKIVKIHSGFLRARSLITH